MEEFDRSLSMDAKQTQQGGRPLSSRDQRRLLALAALVVLVCGLRAVQMAWLSDDAFISFRYARNLHDGLGLVFNAGEYVEGYTNLLWTLAMAAVLHLGLDMELMAHVLGIACWLGLSALLAVWSWQRSRVGGHLCLPLAALLNLLLEDNQRWATGGLETSLFSLLTCAGLLLLAAARTRRRWQFGGGVVLALACLTRPDGAIFAALGVIYSYCEGVRAPLGQRLRDACAVALPLVVTGTVLIAFKLSYYGEWLPTAFYAKSAFDAYYQQGLLYLWLFFSRNWFALAFLPCALWLARARLAQLLTRDNGLWLVAWAAFSYYVVHSAGDFMYARRLLPALPFLWLLFEAVLARVTERRARLGLFCATLLAAALPRALYSSEAEKIDGIANEWAFYPPAYLATSRERGELLGQLLGDTPVRVGFIGGMAMFAYYSGLPYLAEMNGLTQYSLARQPLTARSRVGHEKSADAAWLTSNRIHLLVSPESPPMMEDGHRRFDVIRFGTTMTARIWIYSDAVMDPLRARADVDFVPIETVLAQAEHDIAAASPEAARTILTFLERYYLTEASPRRAAQIDHLRQLVADKNQDP